jgi:hypothetical protein
VALVHGELQRLETCQVVRGQPMPSSALDQQGDVARRGLSPVHGDRRPIRERHEPPFATEQNVDGNSRVEAAVDTFGAIEPLAFLEKKKVGDAPHVRSHRRLDVRHSALARTDRNVEDEPIAVEPGAACRQRMYLPSLEEDRWAHVAAVCEVPDGPLSAPAKGWCGGHGLCLADFRRAAAKRGEGCRFVRVGARLDCRPLSS